jgi:hypothetical protein
LPPADPRRPRKKRAGSIRDAAASAAGSAASPPPSAPGPEAPTPTPKPKPTAPKRKRESQQHGRRQPAPEPSPALPAFPDFQTPSTGWDPWDQTIEAPPGDQFDPNRTLGDWLEAVIPPEAQVHFIRAGQEFAAGVQTTVEHHLGRREGDSGPDGATRIEIE